MTPTREGFLIAFHLMGEPPNALRSDGRFLPLGRGGEGPGEYKGVLTLARSRWTDSLYVADRANARTSILAPDGTYVRSFRTLPVDVDDIAVLRDGSVVLAANLSTPELAGKPLHLYASDGSYVRSFGEHSGAERRLLQTSRRFLAPGSANDVWVVDPGSYIIEHWNIDGTLLDTYRRDADWFQAHESNIALDEQGRRLSMVAGIGRDGDQLVVVSVVPDPEWRSHREQRQVGNRVVTVPSELRKTFDTQIDVFRLGASAAPGKHPGRRSHSQRRRVLCRYRR